MAENSATLQVTDHSFGFDPTGNAGFDTETIIGQAGVSGSDIAGDHPKPASCLQINSSPDFTPESGRPR